MADKTVKELASMINISSNRFIDQLKDAGVDVNTEDDLVSEDGQVSLLAHLRNMHGKTKTFGVDRKPKKITLKLRRVTALKQVTSRGVATKTVVNVEIRKKKTYIKRSESPLSKEQNEIELAKKALEEQKKQIATEAQTFKKYKSIQNTTKEEANKKQNELKQQSVGSTKEIITEDKNLILDSSASDTKQAKQQTDIAKQKLTSDDSIKVKKASESKQLTPEEKARQEAIEINANRIRKQAEAKKQQTLHKKQQSAKSKYNQQGVNKNNNVVEKTTTSAKKGAWIQGRKQTSRKIKDKKGKQRKIQTATNINVKHQFEKPFEPIEIEVSIPESIVVSELAQKMHVKSAEIIKKLMEMGTLTTINQSIDQDTAAILVEEMGHKPLLQNEDDPEREMFAMVTDHAESDKRETTIRTPIVTVMGHVDHGKTSLLDYIRQSHVATSESGGITQRIGAYQVKTDHGNVTFLDTPGHAAFTAMRVRGAKVTDIVIIVVAADDGVMPQTKEAIEHVKIAKAHLIVAINKIDKTESNPENVMKAMAALDVMPESWGGDVPFIEISAKTGKGIDELIETLILHAEIMELKAPMKGAASGFVIESRLDKGRGLAVTLLIKKGVLEKGHIILCGHEYGRVRSMFNEHGKEILTASTSMPVEVMGLSGMPNAGDEFIFVQNEKVARDISEHRKSRNKLSKHMIQPASKLDEAFSNLQSEDTSILNLVIKADVQGSTEALRESLVKLSNDNVLVKCIYSGVGGINEGDANLALATGAILIGFNVRADAVARKLINEKSINLHYYSVIYEVIDEIKRAINGMLAPEIKENIVGLAEVRDIFRSPKLGTIAGCMVIDGLVKRSLPIRVLRDNVVIYDGHLESLRRFKDNISEVKLGMECGIGVKNYKDVKIGDQIEVFENIEVKRNI